MRRCLVGLAALTVLALTACGRNQGLSQSQEDSIESVTSLLKWFGGVAGSFTDLTKVPALGLGTLGECPKLGVRPDGLGLGITFDYSGCEGLPFVPGGGAARGRVAVSANLARLEGNLGFEGFTLAGKTVDGTIGLKPKDGKLTDLRLQVHALNIQNIGTIQGETGLLISTNGSFGMKDGMLEMRDIAGSAFDVRVADLAVNPLRYGNPLPDRGAVSFFVPVKVLGLGDVELKVNFLESTPRNGDVDVLVGPLGPIRYNLKHFGK